MTVPRRVRTQAERAGDDHTWYCGAFQPTPPRRMKPYRCTEPSGHAGDHRAVVDGELVAHAAPTHPEGTVTQPYCDADVEVVIEAIDAAPWPCEHSNPKSTDPCDWWTCTHCQAAAVLDALAAAGRLRTSEEPA